jgi:5-methylphenazine-1-carboxylate 1-monooxygenase
MVPTLDIAIAGAGIGGLTAALTLHAQGHRVRVYEAVKEIRALGVGINVLPHAVEILTEVGLGDALDLAGVRTKEVVFANRFGQAIYADPRGIEGSYTHPQYSIHRGALQTLLLEAVIERLGREALATNARLVDFTQDANGVSATFGEGDRANNVHCDMLIAADGIHSAARRKFYPDEGPPKWNGVMMWRGITRGKPFLSGRSMVQAGHRMAKFVCYPIEHFDDGTALINWIADIRQSEGGTPPGKEDWNKPGRIEDLMPVFGDWKFDYLDVPEVIRSASAILEFPMVDRDPLPRWSFDRVTLLGDAAHPMYPIGSNGATQAILDAHALADAISANEDSVDALRQYELARLPMATEIVAMNRKEGLDAILDLVHQRAPNGFSRLDDVVEPLEIVNAVQRYKTKAGHRPTT